MEINKENETSTSKGNLADELNKSPKRKIARRYSEAPDTGKKRAPRRVSFAPTASLRYVAKLPDPVPDREIKNNLYSSDNKNENNTNSSENTSTVPHFVFDQSLRNSTSIVLGEEQIKTTGSFGTDESPMSKPELNEESYNSIIPPAFLESPVISSPLRNSPLIPHSLLNSFRKQKTSFTAPISSLKSPNVHLPSKGSTTSIVPDSSRVDLSVFNQEASFVIESSDLQGFNLEDPLNNNLSQNNVDKGPGFENSIPSPSKALEHVSPNEGSRNSPLRDGEIIFGSENKREVFGILDISSQASVTPWSFPVYEESCLSRQLPFGINTSETTVFFDPTDNQPSNEFLNGLLKSGNSQSTTIEKNTSTIQFESLNKVQRSEEENEDIFPDTIDEKKDQGNLVNVFFPFDQGSTYSGGDTTKHTLKTGEIYQNFNSSDFEDSSSPKLENDLSDEIEDSEDIHVEKILDNDLTDKICTDNPFLNGANDTFIFPSVSQINCTSMSPNKKTSNELECTHIEPQALSPKASFSTSRVDCEDINTIADYSARCEQSISDQAFDQINLSSNSPLSQNKTLENHFSIPLKTDNQPFRFEDIIDQTQLDNTNDNSRSSPYSKQNNLKNDLNPDHELHDQLPKTSNQENLHINNHSIEDDMVEIHQSYISPTLDAQNRIRGSLSHIRSHTAHNSPICKKDRKSQRLSLPCQLEDHVTYSVSSNGNRFTSKPSPRLREAIQRIITPTSKSRGYLDSIGSLPVETSDVSEEFFVPSFNSPSKNNDFFEAQSVHCPNKFKALEFLNLAGVTFLDSVTFPCRKNSNNQEFIRPASPHTKILSRFIWAPQAIAYRSACQKSELIIKETTSKVLQLENSINSSPSPSIFDYVNLSSSGQRKTEEKLKQLQAAYRCEARYSWFVRMNELGRSLKNRWVHDINSCGDDLFVLESKKETFQNILSDSLKYSKTLELKLQSLKKMFQETETDKNEKMMMLNNSIEEQSHAVAHLQNSLDLKQSERKELKERLDTLTNKINQQSEEMEALKSKCILITPITIEQVSSAKNQFELISEFGLWRFDLISSPPKLFLSNTSVFSLSFQSNTCLIDLSAVEVEPFPTSDLNDPIHTLISKYLTYLRAMNENMSLKKFCFELSRFWHRTYYLLNQVSLIQVEFQARLKFPDFKPDDLNKTIMQLQVDFYNHVNPEPIYFTLGFDVSLRMLADLKSSFPRWGYKLHYGVFSKSTVSDVIDSKAVKYQDPVSQLYLLCKTLEKQITAF